MKYAIYIAIFGLIVCSCNVTRKYTHPDIDMSSLYRDVKNTDSTNIGSLHWKDIFTDTLLQRLITEGINNNLELKTAWSRVREAQAYYKQSRLAFLPAINANGNLIFNGASNRKEIGTTITNQQYQVNITASWEVDVWKKLKSSRLASLASLLQADANARAVQTALVAGVADGYYLLLALDQQLAVTRESVKNWQATVDVMQELKRSDVVTGAAVVQSEASKYAAAVTVPDIEQAIRETENQLNHLLGRAPGPIIRGSLHEQQLNELLHTGVPVQLLNNRPDIQAAEFNLRYYFELTNVARTAFLPSLTISAAGGYLSTHNLFGPGSLISNLSAGLLQPVFNRGANTARLKASEEQQQQALLNFQNTVLQSGQEVSNSLYAYQTALEKIKVRSSQLLNLRKSVDYTQQLVRYGFANYTEVLTAQQSLLDAQLNEVNDRRQQLQSIVSLYRALGGGWQ